MLILESFQAGLSWECVLNKRESFRKAFDEFNIDKVCFYDDKIIYEIDKTTNNISDALSLDLQKRGMKFVGSTIIYSYLQAIGIIYSHDKECFLFKQQL